MYFFVFLFADNKIDGSRLMTIAVGRDLNMLELQGISSRPAQSNLYHILSYNSLDETFFQQIIAGTCDGRL